MNALLAVGAKRSGSSLKLTVLSAVLTFEIICKLIGFVIVHLQIEINLSNVTYVAKKYVHLDEFFFQLFRSSNFQDNLHHEQRRRG